MDLLRKIVSISAMSMLPTSAIAIAGVEGMSIHFRAELFLARGARIIDESRFLTRRWIIV